jgi:hypothetical protein
MLRNELSILITKIYEDLGIRRDGSYRAVYAFLVGDYNLNIRNGVNEGPFLNDRMSISNAHL